MQIRRILSLYGNGGYECSGFGACLITKDVVEGEDSLSLLPKTVLQLPHCTALQPFFLHSTVQAHMLLSYSMTVTKTIFEAKL